jgi:hypothetical protein
MNCKRRTARRFPAKSIRKAFVVHFKFKLSTLFQSKSDLAF